MSSPSRAAALFFAMVSVISCAASTPPPPAVPQGTLPQADIQRVVRSQFGLLRACYQDGLLRNPDLKGRVAIYFVIGTDGTVTQKEDRGSDLPDREVIACIAEKIGLLHFPKPDGGILQVVYPIILNPR